MKKVIQFALAILIAQLAGVIGAFATVSAIPGWYQELAKPFFSPPNWVFGPVWFLLYTLIGVSLFLIWQEEGKEKRVAVTVFFVHLGLNALWPIIFFGLKDLSFAFFEILALFGTLLIVFWKFWFIKRLAVYLLIPYLLWVSFALLLNFAIWQLNP
ncbi:MAG: tryptophan-rich sensory protein [bacterium]|nr:tryptophan-rich sensory protein [bacterium]